MMASYKEEMSIELKKKCLVDIPGLLVHMDIWTYHITSLGHKYPRFPCHVDTSLPNSDGRLDEVKTWLIRYIINGPVKACDGNSESTMVPPLGYSWLKSDDGWRRQIGDWLLLVADADDVAVTEPVAADDVGAEHVADK